MGHHTPFPRPAVQRFVADLHSRGQRWVPIGEAGQAAICLAWDVKPHAAHLLA